MKGKLVTKDQNSEGGDGWRGWLAVHGSARTKQKRGMAGSAGRKHGGGLLTVQDQNWERDGAMQCRTKPEKGDDWQCMAVRDQNREGGWLAVQDQNRKRGGGLKYRTKTGRETVGETEPNQRGAGSAWQSTIKS